MKLLQSFKLSDHPSLKSGFQIALGGTEAAGEDDPVLCDRDGRHNKAKIRAQARPGRAIWSETPEIPWQYSRYTPGIP